MDLLVWLSRGIQTGLNIKLRRDKRYGLVFRYWETTHRISSLEVTESGELITQMLQQRSITTLAVHKGKSQAKKWMLNCFLNLALLQQQLEQCPIAEFMTFFITQICWKTVGEKTNTTNQLEDITLQKATELHLSRLRKESLRIDLS